MAKMADKAAMERLAPAAANGNPEVPEALKKIAAQADTVTQKVEAVNQAHAAQVAATGQSQQTVSSTLGEILWLMSMTPSHRYFFVADMEWLVMTPVVLAQFRMYRDDKGKPVAVVLWAKVSEEVEKRLEEGTTRLAPQDWNSGDRYWLVDVISPQPLGEKLIDDLKQTVFKGKSFKYHRTLPDGMRVVNVVDAYVSD